LGLAWKPGASLLAAGVAGFAGAVAPLAVSLRDSVSLIFGLENIPGGLYEFDWVDGLIVDSDLVMDIVTGTAARASHISDTISPPDALPHLHACAVELSINGFKLKRMPNIHHAAAPASTYPT
jgi:hypothetical protein